MNDMIKEIIINTIVILITGISSYLWGKLRGTKQSTEAITRKEKLYIPIDDEMINFNDNHKESSRR